MDKHERRKAVYLTIGTVVIAWILIVGAYYVLPIGHESGTRAIVRLFIDIALVGAVLVWQMRRIIRADLPEVRAMEALGIVAAFFLAIVSSLYLSMSHASPTTFTEPLDHTRALT